MNRKQQSDKRISKNAAAQLAALLTDGMKVQFQRVMRPEFPWYTGVVDGAAWELGDGTWVVNLRDMDEAYKTETGKTRVSAAMAASLKVAPEARAAAPAL